MERQIISYTDEAAWLAERQKDVTSTDAAALCGVSQWKSRWQLWREKRVGEYAIRDESEPMRWGKRLESAIALGLAADNDLDVVPLKDYARLPEHRIGSSFDYIARDRSYLLEIKLVGPEAFRRGWLETDYGLEAPIEIEAQVQQESLCIDVPLAYIGVFCGTQGYLLRREYQPDVGERIITEADAFWKSPEPAPDFYSTDADFIRKLYSRAEPGREIEADGATAELIARFAEVKSQAKAAQDNADALHAEILTKVGLASRVFTPELRLDCEERGETFVKAHTRRGFRNFRTYPRKD